MIWGDPSQAFGLVTGGLLAFALGLRHATDPDHLTAVSTLAMAEREHGARRCGMLGAAWGVGHATTILALGIPAVVMSRQLPAPVHRTAEAAVGVLICWLAVRLLARWRRGAFHSHTHTHGALLHAHPHGHEHAHELEPPRSAGHEHTHAPALGGSAARAYFVGLVHGVGGSAGATVLLAASVPEPRMAVAWLVVFSTGAAVAMSLGSAVFGLALTRASRGEGWMDRLAPAIGAFGFVFGVWYLAQALGSAAF